MRLVFWEWEPAKAVAGEWTAAGSWTVSGNLPPSQGKSQPSELPTRTTIAEAAETFLAASRNRELSPASLAKYRTFNKQLLAYAEARGYVLFDQLTVADMDMLRGKTGSARGQRSWNV